MAKRIISFFLFVFVVAAAGNAFATIVQEVKSKSGITAWLVEDHTNPVISVRFLFKGGAALDPVGKEGLANLVSGLLDEGAGHLDSQSFQARLEDEAISLRFSASKDSFSGRLKTLSQNLDSGTELLNLALTKPRFDTEPVERIRAQILASVRRDMEQPQTIAADEVFSSLFAGHGYGRRTDGSAESISAITQADLIDFVKTMIAKENLVIGVAGDIGPDALSKFLDDAFGGLPATTNTEIVTEIKPKLSGRIKVIETDIPQSVIIFASNGVKRDDPDFYAALVMNHILGGGSFTSRLYDEVREKRGLAYSISTSVYPFDHSGIILGHVGTENSRVSETIKIIKDQWARMVKNGVDRDELNNAKTYLSGSFPLRFTSSGAIAGILVGMQANDLGLDYLERRKSYIGAVGEKEVLNIARRLLNPSQLDIVVVGKPDGLSSTP